MLLDVGLSASSALMFSLVFLPIYLQVCHGCNLLLMHMFLVYRQSFTALLTAVCSLTESHGKHLPSTAAKFFLGVVFIALCLSFIHTYIHQHIHLHTSYMQYMHQYIDI